MGRRRHELTTPALILDLTLLRQNLETMAEWTRMHAKVRPNAKDSPVWGDRAPAGYRRRCGHHDGDRSAGGTNTYDMTGAKPA